MKLAIFRNTIISVKFHEIRDFSTFTFIYEGFQSFIIQQLLCGFCCVLSECHTSALSSWHLFTVLLTYLHPTTLGQLAYFREFLVKFDIF